MRNLTFVVQGKIQPNTKGCLESIRHFYPESKIVLSTWEGEATDGLTYDLLKLSRDPGAYEFMPGGYYNLNRQIVSTINGLRLVTTEFAVKIRTDTQITSRKIPEVLKRQQPGQLFETRIAALNLFFRDPSRYPLLFHIGDIFHVGRTADLVRLWDIPLAVEPATSNWMQNKTHFFGEPLLRNARYAPEQYIFVAFLNRCGYPVSLRYCSEMTVLNAAISEETIARNFTIYTLEELGITIPSRIIICGSADSVYASTFLEKKARDGTHIKSIWRMVRKHKRREWKYFIKNFLLRPAQWWVLAKIFVESLAIKLRSVAKKKVDMEHS